MLQRAESSHSHTVCAPSDWSHVLLEWLAYGCTLTEAAPLLGAHRLQAITDLVNDPWQNIPAERRESLESVRTEVMNEFFPHGSRAGIEA